MATNSLGFDAAARGYSGAPMLTCRSSRGSGAVTMRNLLFRIVTAPDPRLDLHVSIGAPEYPRAAASNPSEFVAMIRQKLTDSKRLLRIYGSEVVIGRLTGDGSRARLHLLNYGGRKVEGVRVRVLGVYKNVQILTPRGAGTIGDLVAAE